MEMIQILLSIAFIFCIACIVYNVISIKRTKRLHGSFYDNCYSYSILLSNKCVKRIIVTSLLLIFIIVGFITTII